MPDWSTYISLDQLGHPKASVRDVVQLATTINRQRGLTILGTYNLALSLSAIKDGGTPDMAQRLASQEALLRNSVSERRLRELRDKLGRAKLI
jgi:hypothetical protein